MNKIIFLLIVTIVGLWMFLPQPEREQPPGVLVDSVPFQEKVKEPILLKDGDAYKDYAIRAIAKYEIRARVLSKEKYSFDKESDLSTYDLALGWKEMSNNAVLDSLNISQAGRWYHYSWSNRPPIPPSQIETESANTHVIAGNETVRYMLDKVIKGDVVTLRGYLVNVSDDNGWKWHSSTSRYDKRGGSCELMWLDEIEIE